MFFLRKPIFEFREKSLEKADFEDPIVSQRQKSSILEILHIIQNIFLTKHLSIPLIFSTTDKDNINCVISLEIINCT